CGNLQRLPTQGTLNREREGAATHAQLRRGLPGSGAPLPRDGGLQEGDAETPGLGGATFRRGQGVARATPAPLTRLAEREHPGPAGRERAESGTVARGNRVVPAPRPCGSLLALPKEPQRLMA